MASIWERLQGGANKISGLLYPGFDSAGVDPRAAQAARAQAMMQMGAGLLGGANFGQAYGAGQQSGFEPIEQARREAVLRSDADWRKMQTDEIERRRQSEDAEAQQAAALKAQIAPLIQAGDYEGAKRVLAGNLQFGAAKDVGALGGMDEGAKIGAYNPGDYTPQSFATFMAGGKKDPSVLQRQYAPQQPPAPVVVSVPGYGTALVDRRTGQPIQQFTTPEQETQAKAAMAGAERAATESAATDVATKKDAKDRDAALRLYETAAEGLKSGLAGSQTGPVVGRIPAVTSAQQVAEGGVAAMAPVLKQLFRVAGEGVFTDRDQQLLLDMVPKRTDTPEARDAKMANIDKIVRAKLRAPESGAPTKIMGNADYDRLPSGALFIGPDGKTRRKP